MITQDIRKAFFVDKGYHLSDSEMMIDKTQMSFGNPDDSLNILGRGNPNLEVEIKSMEQIDQENDALVSELGMVY